MYVNEASSVKIGQGHLNLPKDQAAREDLITATIKAWRLKSKEERLAEAFSRAELKSMGSRERLIAIDNGLLSCVMGHYANNPRIDSSPGVLMIMILLSDNGDYGAAYISTTRIGMMLSRHRNVIGRDLEKLVDEGWLVREERPGSSHLYYPVLSRDFSASADMFRFINVYAPASTNRGGRPRKVSPVEVGDVEKTPAPVGSAWVSETPAPEDGNPCIRTRVHDSPNEQGGVSRARDWSRVLNPTVATASADCWFDDNGRVHVANGFEAELLGLAGSDAAVLREVLDIAAKWVSTEVNPLHLKKSIRASFTKELADRRDKTKRYERAVARGQDDRSRPQPNGKPQTGRAYTGSKPYQPEPERVTPKDWPPSRWRDAYEDHISLGRPWPKEYGPPPSDPNHIGPRDVLKPFLREVTQ